MISWTMQFRRLKKLLRRRGQSAEDAEDLVQEAFVRLQTFLNQGNVVQRPEAFLARAALNLAVDRYRRDRREHRERHESESVEELPLIDIGPTPEEILAAERRLGQIRHVLDTKVSSVTREVFFLHRLEGFTHSEIAERLGLSVRSVETHIARAVTAIWMERERE